MAHSEVADISPSPRVGVVHGRTQSALSQVYACKYAHSRLNHRHSNGYSRELFFFGVVGALLGYNYEKSEAPENNLAESRLPVAVSAGCQSGIWQPAYGGIEAKKPYFPNIA